MTSARGHVRYSARGFALLTMLVALLLLSVFALVAARLTTSTMKATKSSQDSQTRSVRFDGMLRRLQRDAWNARAISVANPTTAVLEQGGGGRITWRVGEDQAIARTLEPARADEPAQQWSGLAANLTFREQAGTLRVRVRDGPVRREDEIILSSQLIAGRRAP